jgi:hypothetical protein
MPLEIWIKNKAIHSFYKLSVGKDCIFRSRVVIYEKLMK